MHLAQLNVGKLKYPVDDPRVADFVNALDKVNAMAERMPGFVWRLVGEGNNALDIRVFDDPTMAVNMSVWESPEQLEQFVWNTLHKHFYNRKAEWFAALKSNHLVMWFIEEGHVPTLNEARERLEHLDANGNSEFAFDWKYLPHIKLWLSQRCSA